MNGEFKGWISPNDVIQGALGDCYFLSALSVLAANPDRLTRLFLTKEANASGACGACL